MIRVVTLNVRLEYVLTILFIDTISSALDLLFTYSIMTNRILWKVITMNANLLIYIMYMTTNNFPCSFVIYGGTSV